MLYNWKKRLTFAANIVACRNIDKQNSKRQGSGLRQYNGLQKRQ